MVEPPALRRPFGAVPSEDGLVSFRVWAPNAAHVAVRLSDDEHALEPVGDGVHETHVAARPGDDYRYVLDGGEPLPDPWSRWQPEGILGPSRVVDTAAFVWSDDAWEGLRLDELVLYELHVGTFTDGGTLESAIPHLRELEELGVTAVELMPVAEFPGERGWGYDGIFTSAPHHAYGGPEGLVRFVDAAHAAGLGVVLDVVYNHVGPGAQHAAFGPFFTDRHHTFWGDALDYAQAGVREWALQNAELWVRDYHVDGLRLDATHAVFDDGPRHVLADLADRVRAVSPRVLVTSEMETGDLRPIEEWGHDAQWADELHHEQHVILTGEREGYYGAYAGSVEALARQLVREPPERLIVCTQNHDQIGNRPFGDRPPRELQPLQALVLLFAPQTPLLFMGQEHADPAPFQFFTDHVDPLVADATRRGRREEFRDFAGFAAEDVPDPQDPETFARSKLTWTGEPALRSLVQQLLRLRRELPRETEVGWNEEERWLVVRRGPVELVANFSDREVDVGGTVVPPQSGVLR
ncbi:MAG: alpha-amylase family glycosyl hydrolase [Pseudomonadota bacterium]